MAHQTILVAEDDKSIRDILCEFLRSSGYQVLLAQNGVEALEWFTKCRIDLALLDIVMPLMDGFTTCAEIRKFADIPIVMLSGRHNPNDVVRGLELGADEYITKPFTLVEIEARLHAILRRTEYNYSPIPLCSINESNWPNRSDVQH